MIRAGYFSRYSNNDYFCFREHHINGKPSLTSDESLKQIYDSSADLNKMRNLFRGYIFYHPEANIKILDWWLTLVSSERTITFNVIGRSFEKIYNMVKKYDIKSDDIYYVIKLRPKNSRESSYKSMLIELEFEIQNTKIKKFSPVNNCNTINLIRELNKFNKN